MPETNFVTARRDNILYATLTPQSTVSSFSMGLLEQIDAFCLQIEGDASLCGAIITGSGKTFSIGSDLAQIERGLNDMPNFREYLDKFNDVMDRVEALPVPVIAAVNGLARAGGLELVLACDLAVIAEDATIGDGHSAQFAIPAGGSTQRLPRRIGVPRAKDLTWSGRFLTANEAVEWGLCYASAPTGKLMEEAQLLMERFIDKPRPCLAEIKHLIARSETMSKRDGVELEIQAFLNYVGHYPFVRDAITKFRENRAAAKR